MAMYGHKILIFECIFGVCFALFYAAIFVYHVTKPSAKSMVPDAANCYQMLPVAARCSEAPRRCQLLPGTATCYIRRGTRKHPTMEYTFTHTEQQMFGTLCAPGHACHLYN